ncbi:MAG: IS3 family transposase, partial [Atopobiaceae bacterium]|nr:IS3 family transposase [Atopobiaceae bacterium]
LYKWHREYAETGCVVRRSLERYTDEQKRDAVEHYISHGKCNARTRRALGYPGSYEQLAAWIDEYAPGARKTRKHAGSYTDEERKEAVLDLVARKIPAGEVAAAHGVTRATLYQWKRLLVGKEPIEMRKPGLPDDPEKLADMVVDLQEQVRKLQLRKDVLEGTVELLGKGRGADPNRLTNREKTALVEALRRNHRLKYVLEAVGLARSSHQYQVEAMRRPDKYAELRSDIRRLFAASDGTYGYRRIHMALASEGTRVSEKVVARIMREERLDARRCRKRRRWSSYAGEISEAPENLVGRDFHADAPNELWLTDITEFRIPAGKVYLSPLIDCFDGMVVSWSMSTSPDADLANTMLESAVRTLSPDEHPVVHNDRGCHYRWPGWVAICEENGLVRSMSRKGCSPDNSAMEGFFGRMKVEMFYGRSWRGVSIEGFMDAADAYIRWYNSGRIKVTLDGMSPMQYRESLGLAA